MCNIVYCVEEFVKSLHKKVEIQDILVPISTFEVNKIWPPFLLIKIKSLNLQRENFVKIKSIISDFLALNRLKTQKKILFKTGQKTNIFE